MSIKSDRWIRRMASTEGMIEPFEPGQIRESENGRIISYGTSSYGYDVRCADEFKIFTNIYFIHNFLSIINIVTPENPIFHQELFQVLE